MKKTNKITVTIIIITFILSLFILFIGIFINAQKNLATEEKYILKSDGNNVVLSHNGKVIKVFNEIILDTLPITDRNMLEEGIEFNNKSAALNAAEDYDG